MFTNDKLSQTYFNIFLSHFSYAYYTYFTIRNKIRIIHTVALWHVQVRAPKEWSLSFEPLTATKNNGAAKTESWSATVWWRHSVFVLKQTATARTGLCRMCCAEQKRRTLEWRRRDYDRPPQWSDHSLVFWHTRTHKIEKINTFAHSRMTDTHLMASFPGQPG